MRLYLAGPMSGVPEFNAPAFRSAAHVIRELGHDVLSPVEFDEEEGFVHANLETGAQVSEEQYVGFLRRDFLRILGVNSFGYAIGGQADGAVVLDGWEQSRGARAEVHLLRALGRPIYRIVPVEGKAEYALEEVTDEPTAVVDASHPSSARFHAVLRELGALHDRKGEDYGRADDPFANVRASGEWGVPEWVGAMVRATDKVRRLQTFARRGTLANEGARDAFLDLSVYAVIACVLWEEECEAPAM